MDIQPAINVLPDWLQVLTGLLALCIIVYLKFGEAIYKASKTYLDYTKKKHQLELQKLHYEIEQIKKDAGLPDLPIEPDEKHQAEGSETQTITPLSFVSGILIGVFSPIILLSIYLMEQAPALLNDQDFLPAVPMMMIVGALAGLFCRYPLKLTGIIAPAAFSIFILTTSFVLILSFA
ncbi:MAG: hypothetical protein ACRBB6_02985 [Neptuniibacter sp.]